MTDSSVETTFGLKYRVKPDSKFHLSDIPSDSSAPFNRKGGKEKADQHIAENLEQIGSLQNVLYASRKAALLIILQGIDAAGKDGTIKHVLSGVNPQGCYVRSFKVPTEEEKFHDVLWRVHKYTPERGIIGIFNRSHYEEVLVARVHKLKPRSVWQKHYEQFNAFEKMLSDNGTVILKFFLCVSQEEQLKRIEERLTRPDKKWKYSSSDLVEREYWDDYQKAYEDMLTKCSTEHAPWYVIPSDKKWYRNFLISSILCDTLKNLDLKYPDSRKALSNQAP